MDFIVYKRKTLFWHAFTLIMVLGFALPAQSLWKDHNPYAVGSNIKKGSILKLQIDEIVKIDYSYKNLTDENIDINIIPDKNITNFLPTAQSNRTINKNYTNRLNSKTRIQIQMAVIISDDPNNNLLSFTGTKLLEHEATISSQQIQVSGLVHMEDIASGRKIHSKDIADLKITLAGVPVPKSANLPLSTPTKEAESAKETPQAQAEKVSVPSLTEEQKQKLLWEYINRILGETL